MSNDSKPKPRNITRALLCVSAGIGISWTLMNVASIVIRDNPNDWARAIYGLIAYFTCTVVLGLVLIGVSSLGKPRLVNVIGFVGLGSFSAVFAIPVIAKLWEVAYVQPAFQRLCERAHVSYGTPDDSIDGVLLTSDSDGHVTVEFLLVRTPLQFVERQARNGKGGKSERMYERLAIKGTRYDDPSADHRGEFSVASIKQPMATFELVVATSTSMEGNVEETRVELRKRSDTRPVASALAYWHRGFRKACPEGVFSEPNFISRFVLYALEMRR